MYKLYIYLYIDQLYIISGCRLTSCPTTAMVGPHVRNVVSNQKWWKLFVDVCVCISGILWYHMHTVFRFSIHVEYPSDISLHICLEWCRNCQTPPIKLVACKLRRQSSTLKILFLDACSSLRWCPQDIVKSSTNTCRCCSNGNQGKVQMHWVWVNYGSMTAANDFIVV